MKNSHWKEWFLFTKKERTGIIVLVTLILTATCLPWLYTAHLTKPDKYLTKRLSEDLLQVHGSTDSATLNNGAYDNYLPQYDVAAEKKPLLFEFDPNTLSADGWRKLGIRERAVRIIQKYLSRGGKFRQPADLRKIYGLRAEEAARLIPYVRIHMPEAIQRREEFPAYEKREPSSRREEFPGYKKREPSPRREEFPAYKNHEPSSRREEFPGYKNHEPSPRREEFLTYKKRQPSAVDINAADTAAFIALPGIGSKLAKRIITFREKLGGFYSIEQVKETYGLPDSTFQQIRGLLQITTGSVAKININAATAEELDRHPYISRNLANAIVKYREQHGAYNSIEDLKKIVLITPEIFEKIVHYLAVQ